MVYLPTFIIYLSQMSANIPYMDGMGIVIASGYFFWTLWTLVSNGGETSEDDSQEVQYSIVLYCQQSGDFIPWSQQPPFWTMINFVYRPTKNRGQGLPGTYYPYQAPPPTRRVSLCISLRWQDLRDVSSMATYFRGWLFACRTTRSQIRRLEEWH